MDRPVSTGKWWQGSENTMFLFKTTTRYLVQPDTRENIILCKEFNGNYQALHQDEMIVK